MPGFDGTGPVGYGALTGRGLGPCGAGLGFRRGTGRGMGRGVGRGYRRFPAQPVTLTKEEQKKVLEEELKEIDAEKQEIEKQLNELNK